VAEHIKISPLRSAMWENFGGDPFFSLPPEGRYRLVALTRSEDLFDCAKQLLIDANGTP
jgi:hypothetical protein